MEDKITRTVTVELTTVEELLRDEAAKYGGESYSFTNGWGLYWALRDGSLPVWACNLVEEWACDLYPEVVEAVAQAGLSIPTLSWAGLLDVATLDGFADRLIEMEGK